MLSKKFKDEFTEGIANGLGFLVVIGGLAIGFYLVQRYVGLFSYLGLDESQIASLAQEMDSRCTILTRACNDRGCRGIYLGGACGFPLYYHYKKDSYDIYPLLWDELWSTKKDMFGLTGKTMVNRTTNLPLTSYV